MRSLSISRTVTAHAAAASLRVMGELRTEQLDIAPAQLRVRATCRPRYVCNSCDGVLTVTPAPERPIDGSMATEALIDRAWHGESPGDLQGRARRRSGVTQTNIDDA